MKNNKGMAMVEALPIILVMFVLMGATLGSWGIVHTAILNSIAARNWTFFYFNNRSDLSYLRDFAGQGGYGLTDEVVEHYFRKDTDDNEGIGKRYIFIQSEKAKNSTIGMRATLRRADFRDVDYDQEPNNHLPPPQHSTIGTLQPKNTEEWRKDGQKSRAWVTVGYGICLSATCGE